MGECRSQHGKRKSGINILGDIPWGTHLCQFYRTKEDLIEVLVPYFKAGLENNEFCMWVTSEPLIADEAEKSLRKAVKNLDEYINKGQIKIMSYGQWYTKSGKFEADKVLQAWINKENEARKKGYDGLRLAGNTFWLEEKDWRDFADYELAVNNAFPRYRMLAVCPYSLDKCEASEVIDVVSSHQFALIRRNGNWEVIESSERKKAQEALEEKEAFNFALFQYNPIQTIVVDNEGRVIKTNLAKRISGDRLPNIGDMMYRDYAGKHEIDMRAELMECIRTGKKKDFAELKYGDKFLNVTIAPFPRGAIITSQDITERKKSEEEYRTVVRTAMDGYWAVDTQGRFLDVSGVYCRLIGYSREELLKMKIQDIEAVETPEEVAQRIRRIMASGGDRFETQHRCRDGKIIDVEVSVNYLKEAGGRMFVFLRDITERKKAEQELKESRQLLDKTFRSLRDAVFIIDAENVEIMDCNPAANKIFGYSRSEMIGKTTAFLHVDKAALEEFRSYLYPAVKEKGFLFLPEFRMKKKDGTIFPTEHSVVPLEDEKRKFIGWVSVVRDITERKRVEEEIKESREQMRNLAAHLASVREQERTVISREIHDELGQSLTALKMDLSWLYKKMPRDQALLPRRAKSMLELIDTTIQSVKRISSELRPGLLDDLGLSAAIEWQAEEFQNHTGIRCEVSVEPEDIILDQERSIAIFRIFQEALTNVARHSKATSVRASLKRKGGRLELKVKDNGRGITEEKISDPKSFGLVGIRERARFLNGTVEIRGRQDRGTLITVRIPLPKKGKNDKNPHRG
jgi:hypothetical protein